jgi:nucleoid DNA-binding protein
MFKAGIDQNALIEQFASASARQTAQLKQAVTEATLKALQGREMTLKNIRSVVKSVSEAASAGAAQNTLPKVDAEKMLATAVAGIDDALLKAVEANKVALSRFVDQGVGLQEKQLKKAMDDLEKFEDTMFAALKKAASGASAPLAGPWAEVLEKFQAKGSVSGAQAAATVEQLSDQMQQALREGRAVGIKAAQALAQSYTALVSGVLMGMSDALSAGAAAAEAPAKSAPRKR